jgi:hypothetical protein
METSLIRISSEMQNPGCSHLPPFLISATPRAKPFDASKPLHALVHGVELPETIRAAI